MGRWRSIHLAALLTGLIAAGIGAQEKQVRGGGDETGAYQVVAGWPKPLPDHEAWVPGPVTAIFAESPDRVFIAERGELPRPPARRGGGPAPTMFGTPARTASAAVGEARREHFILIVNRAGTVVDSWTQWDTMWEGSRGPHHIKISPYDPEKHVWIIDDDLQQVLKFTNDGKQLVMTLGERLVAGNDDKHFGRPTDVAWLPDGTFFVTDGYTNTRVLKFDKDGKFLMTWGTPGSGPGQFQPPVHAVAIDGQRRVYVADRGNSRVQIFDENGKFLQEWPNIRDPWDVHIASDQSVWVVDGTTNKFLKFDRHGNLQYSWGTWGQFPGGIWGVHQFSVDQEGNLYTAEAYHGRAQKFRPRPDGAPPNVIAKERPLGAIQRK